MNSDIKEPENTDAVEAENFEEKLCSGTFKANVLSDDGFSILKEKGLL